MWRYLRGNKTNEAPRHVFCVDTETLRGENPQDPFASVERLRLGVGRYMRIDGGKTSNHVEFAFNTTDQFWSWLARRVSARSVNWVFAHGAGFDARVLGWGVEIDKGRLLLNQPTPKTARQGTASKSERRQSGLLVCDSPPTILECWFPGGAKLRIVDLRNWMNRPLADIGDKLGLPKLPMPDPWESDESWLTYCRRDCEILELAVARLFAWQKEHDLGVFKSTLPGQAMQCYRHRFHSCKIVLHDVLACSEFERKGYYAGRLAIFYVGEIKRSDKGVHGLLSDKFTEAAPKPVGPVYKLDCNSLFPSVMKTGRFPKRLIEYCPEASSGCLMPGGEDVGIIARVRLRHARNEYPRREGGQVDFASGEFETVLAGEEFKRAVGCGEVAEILAWAAYETDDLFSNYVDYFYQLRFMASLAGNYLEASLCKLMLNSLYGKFAQRLHEWVNQPGLCPPEPWSEWVEIDRPTKTIKQYRSIGEMVQLRTDRGHHPGSFPAISAFVTAAARVKMDALRQLAGWHNVYYQGVDSLYVSPLGLERLQAAGEVDQTALGKLRLEGESDECLFLGCGVYLFDGTWTRCSIRRGAHEVRIGEFEQDQFESFERSLGKAPSEGVSVRTVTRKLETAYSLAGCTDNGWVRPKVGRACESSPRKMVDPSTLCESSVSLNTFDPVTFGRA